MGLGFRAFLLTAAALAASAALAALAEEKKIASRQINHN
jgi:hypothetical protein